jgi:hypothetical protein
MTHHGNDAISVVATARPLWSFSFIEALLLGSHFLACVSRSQVAASAKRKQGNSAADLKPPAG